VFHVLYTSGGDVCDHATPAATSHTNHQCMAEKCMVVRFNPPGKLDGVLSLDSLES
jgi:hypothetical protein